MELLQENQIAVSTIQQQASGRSWKTLSQTQVESEIDNIIQFNLQAPLELLWKVFNFLCCTAIKPMLPKASAIING